MNLVFLRSFAIIIEKTLFVTCILICSTLVFYFMFSEEGNVHCVHSVFDGTAFHTTVINPGDVSQSSHHRFSCFVSFILIDFLSFQ